MGDRRAKLAFLLLAGMFSIAIIAGTVIADRLVDPFYDRSFSRDAWVNGTVHDRCSMASDAIRHVPPGTTADAVGLLLGPASFVFPMDRAMSGEAGEPFTPRVTWSYFLALGGSDSAYLYVHFDADKRVVEAELVGR